MTQWYYADRHQQRQGPVVAEALRDLFWRGAVTADTLVWRDGLTLWVRLQEMAAELELELDTPPVRPANAATSMRRDAPVSPYAAPASTLSVGDGAVVTGGAIAHAGFWRRVAASLLDTLITGVLGAVLGGVLGIALGVLAVMSGQDAAHMLERWSSVIELASFALSVLYYAGFHASRAKATPGKIAVGIQVVRPDGAQISITRAIVRLFATILSGIILGIGYLLAAFTTRKQALHDLLCDTLVVDKWAFSAHPERQKRGLDIVTVVVLSAFGLLLLVGGIVLAVALAMH